MGRLFLYAAALLTVLLTGPLLVWKLHKDESPQETLTTGGIVPTIDSRVGLGIGYESLSFDVNFLRQSENGHARRWSDMLILSAIVEWREEWFLYRPTWNCPSAEPIGVAGDGAKWICVDLVPPSGFDCLVYSIGIDSNIKFDLAFKNRFPHCEIHGFESRKLARNILNQLTENGITGHEHWHVTSIKAIQEELGHTGRRIAVLKIDIEGGEFVLLRNLLAEKIAVTQMQIEFHRPAKGKQPLSKCWDAYKSLVEAHFRLFFAESNYLAPAKCLEVALVWNADAHSLLGV